MSTTPASRRAEVYVGRGEAGLHPFVEGREYVMVDTHRMQPSILRYLVGTEPQRVGGYVQALACGQDQQVVLYNGIPEDLRQRIWLESDQVARVPSETRELTADEFNDVFDRRARPWYLEQKMYFIGFDFYPCDFLWHRVPGATVFPGEANQLLDELFGAADTTAK